MKETYTIQQVDDGWYWHVSRPGRPGEESDFYPTRDEAERAVKAEFPNAIPNWDHPAMAEWARYVE